MSKIYDELCNAGHIAANHRGDDPAAIGSFPCECSEDLEDMRAKGSATDKALIWALDKIDEIFREAAERRKREGLLSNDEAWNAWFNGRKQ